MADGAHNAAVAAEWVSRQLSAALEARRSNDGAKGLPFVDAVLKRQVSNPIALDLGLKLAREVGSHEHIVRYSAIRLAQQPNRSSFRIDLATALLAGGVPDAAIDVIDTLIANEPRSTAALGLKLRALLAAHDEAGIARFLDELADRKPLEVSLVDWLARFLGSLGETDRAMAWLSRPAEAFSEISLKFLRARLLYSAGRYTEAKGALAALGEDGLEPKHQLETNLFLGRIAMRENARASAVGYYKRVLDLAPANEEAADAIVRYRLASGDRAGAEEILVQFEAAAPQSPMRVWLRAAVLVSEGRASEAVTLYRAAIESSPRTVEHYCRFADLLADMNDSEQMAAVMDQGFKIAPESPRVFARRIRAAQLRDRYDDLIAICEDFLSVEPDNETAMLQRANALLRSGRREDALEQYLSGARRHQRNVNFWRGAASLATSFNRRELAKLISDEVSKIFGAHSVDDLSAQAEILEVASFSDEALAAAEEAVALDHSAIGPNQIAARLLAAKGAYAGAWPHLKVLKAKANRSLPSVRLFAQVAAGFRYLRPSQADLVEIEPIDSRFPDVLFDEIVSNSQLKPEEECNDLVLHVSSSLASGGAERQVALTVAALNRHRGGVEFVADDLDPANGRNFFLPLVEDAAVPVHILRNMRNEGRWRDLLAAEPHRREAVRVLGAMPRDLAHMALPMFTLFCERRPRVVHLWQDMISVAGGIAATLAGVPHIVLGMRSTRPVEQQRARPYFHAAYQALLQRPGVSMIANSRNGAADYEQWLGLVERRVGTVFNGYDFIEMRIRAEEISAAAIRAEAGIPEDALLLGGVMRCSFEKRPELWTEVACGLAKRDPRVYGVLVGDGPMRTELMERVDSLGLADRIKFVGRKAPIEPWMRAMDVLYLTSITEGLPNVLIESQAVGTPVVTMRVGGAPETVRENATAVVADEGSPDYLCDAVGTLLFDSNLRRTYGEAGLTWVDRTFSVDALMEKLSAIYEGRV